jgi:hypothetical protein
MRIIIFLLLLLSKVVIAQQQVEKWGMAEIVLKGTDNGNPFTEVTLSAQFTNGSNTVKVPGFYDGNGIYKIRFMPTVLGTWAYTTTSNSALLNNKKGTVQCKPNEDNNHGPVRVFNKHLFEYADGTPYYPFGTTCYAWTHQPDSLQELTLKTLSKGYFNKMRMCVMPKHYSWNNNEPILYPYEGTSKTNWDFSRPNPKFFQMLEKRIVDLMKLNIECDLILFHQYDFGFWNFDITSDKQDDFYLRYMIARLSAYRNMWWSLSNEYDLMRRKQEEDWDRFFSILEKEDPYQHLRSIHNCNRMYDHKKSWVTHVSIQGDTWDTKKWIDEYDKPVIVDECKYEGNIKYNWGDLTPEAMTLRFWNAVTQGGYASHGETYMHPTDIIWWSKGGVLRGQSPERIKFLRDILEQAPKGGGTFYNGDKHSWNLKTAININNNFFLHYFDDDQPVEREITLPDDKRYKGDIIDTWNMTITPLQGIYSGINSIPLPGKPYIALRFIEVK